MKNQLHYIRQWSLKPMEWGQKVQPSLGYYRQTQPNPHPTNFNPEDPVDNGIPPQNNTVSQPKPQSEYPSKMAKTESTTAICSNIL
jgi:hypothetical protein